MLHRGDSVTLGTPTSFRLLPPPRGFVLASTSPQAGLALNKSINYISPTSWILGLQQYLLEKTLTTTAKMDAVCGTYFYIKHSKACVTGTWTQPMDISSVRQLVCVRDCVCVCVCVRVCAVSYTHLTLPTS